MILLEIFGWLGSAFIILAYALSSLSIIKADSKIYQLLNIIGAFAVGIIAMCKNTLQPVVVELIWILIASYGLFLIYKNKKTNKEV